MRLSIQSNIIVMSVADVYTISTSQTMFNRIVTGWAVLFVLIWLAARARPDTYNAAIIPVSICLVASSHILGSMNELLQTSGGANFHFQTRKQSNECQTLDFCLQFITECVVVGMSVLILVKQTIDF